MEFKQFINSHPTINETYKTKGLIEIGIYLKSTGSWTGDKITDKYLTLFLPPIPLPSHLFSPFRSQTIARLRKKELNSVDKKTELFGGKAQSKSLIASAAGLYHRDLRSSATDRNGDSWQTILPSHDRQRSASCSLPTDLPTATTPDSLIAVPQRSYLAGYSVADNKLHRRTTLYDKSNPPVALSLAGTPLFPPNTTFCY